MPRVLSDDEPKPSRNRIKIPEISSEAESSYGGEVVQKGKSWVEKKWQAAEQNENQQFRKESLVSKKWQAAEENENQQFRKESLE